MGQLINGNRIRRWIVNHGGPLSGVLYRAANKYVRAYKNLNYDMATNGEAHVLDQLSEFDVKTVFDVGANKGEYTLACLRRFPGADIHAFEIMPATYEKFIRNVTSPRVHINNRGLSDAPGKVMLNYFPDDDGASSMLDNQIHKLSVEKVECEVTTGDIYRSQNGITAIDLLKVDVEGAENLVFDGFRTCFEQGRISVVQFEFGMVNIYSKFLLKDFWEFFSSRGFVLGPVMPRGVDFMEHDTRNEDFQGPPNFVAVHKSKQHLVDALALRR